MVSMLPMNSPATDYDVDRLVQKIKADNVRVVIFSMVLDAVPRVIEAGLHIGIFRQGYALFAPGASSSILRTATGTINTTRVDICSGLLSTAPGVDVSSPLLQWLDAEIRARDPMPEFPLFNTSNVCDM